MLHIPLLALALLFQGQSGFPTKHLTQKPEPTKVLAKVNGTEIKASDVEAYLWDWRASEALEELIITRLVNEQAAKFGIQVEDTEVQAELDRWVQQYQTQLGPGQSVDDALRAQGMPKSRLFMQVRNDLLVTRLAEKEFLPAQFVKVSTIAIKPVSEQTTALAEAIEKMTKVYDRLKAGDKWDVVLKSVTTDQRIVDAKGELGWKQLTAFPQSVQAEMKGLKAGEFTKPAQTSYGIQVFRIDAKGEILGGKDLADLKAQFMLSAKQNLVNRLRTESKVERFLK